MAASRTEILVTVLAAAMAFACTKPAAPAPHAAAVATSPPELPSPGPLAVPFLVDLSTEQTAMWQRAVRGSVAVVAFDRHTLRWLEGCSAPGLYGSRRVRTDPASASLQGIDEIRLNIPARADWADMNHLGWMHEHGLGVAIGHATAENNEFLHDRRVSGVEVREETRGPRPDLVARHGAPG